MAAIGKRRDDGQQRKRRESGVRRQDRQREVVDAPPMSVHPVHYPPAREGAPRPPVPSAAHSERGGAPGPTDPRIREDAAFIEWLLDQAWQRLSHMPDAPLCRELRLVVDRYRRALREWTTQPPTEVQRTILLDCVKALHGRVVSRSSGKRSAK